jgi:hypothetical protein
MSGCVLRDVATVDRSYGGLNVKVTLSVLMFYITLLPRLPTGSASSQTDLRVRFPLGAGNFSRHRVQTGSGAHPAFSPVDTGTLYLRVKRPACEAHRSPPSSAEECVELHLHSPNTSS